jgi:aryl-alcohol dehydrogenase-like predicted oxidoreductase
VTNRLALGTAQLGLRYGVTNATGQITRDAGAAILAHARENEIDTLDTAIAYGDSEQRLGEIGIDGWNVVTKLPAIPHGCADVGAWSRSLVTASLSRLGVPRLHGLLLHRPAELLGEFGGRLTHVLQELKRDGLVAKIGVSIYEPAELDALWARVPLDIVQAPMNVVDRRMQTSGWLDTLQRNGVEIHTRSTFLQGLLLIDAKNLPPQFARWRSLWDQWTPWLEAQGVTPLEMCLGYVLSHRAVDRVIVGLDSLAHLQQIVSSARALVPSPPDFLMSDDLDLINPSRWTHS